MQDSCEAASHDKLFFKKGTKYKNNIKNWYIMGHFSSTLVDIMISNCYHFIIIIVYPARQQMATQTYSNCNFTH